MSEGTLSSLVMLEEQIKAALGQARSIPQEGNMQGQLVSIQAVTTRTLTSSQSYCSRDHRAITDQGQLTQVTGSTAHDAQAYRSRCYQSWWCASLLRPWRLLSYEMGLRWTSKMVRTQQNAGPTCQLDLAMPFDHHRAERDLCMINIQPEVSGTLRCDDETTCPAHIRGAPYAAHTETVTLFGPGGVARRFPPSGTRNELRMLFAGLCEVSFSVEK